MSWKRFFHRSEWDAERQREIDAYLEFETEENVARGMTEEEARYAARRKFGNPTLIREEIYRMNSVGFLETVWQDLRYGARGLRLSPGFAAVAIVSLALGIGANAAIFQLFDAVRLKLLPVKDPQQLAEVKIADQHDYFRGNSTGRRPNLTNALWEQIRARQQVFSGIAAFGESTFNVAPRGEVRNVDGLFVSGGFFHVLGVPPVIGRVFTTRDDQRGCGSPGAVLSYSFWQRDFGGEASAIGRKLTLNGQPFQVIGVTPASFFGVDVGHRFDVAVPICSEPLLEPDRDAVSKRNYWWLAAIGRLRADISTEQANAQLNAISPSIFQATVPAVYNAEDAKNYLNFRLGAFPAKNGFSSVGATYDTPLILLLAIAGLVLLVACVNLANLMLARASVRGREIAVRLAIGASRFRLIRQLLAESLLLALIGAAAGIILAQMVTRCLILLISTSGNQVVLDTAPDWRVLGFTAALAVVTCVLFGLTPALRATCVDPSAAMRAGGHGLSAGRERFGLRRCLAVSQVTLSLVLLAGALLFVRSLTNLLTLNAGFQQDRILTAHLDMTNRRLSADRQRVFNRDLLERLRHTPGVDAAAIVDIEPATESYWHEYVTMRGKDDQKQVVDLNRVSEGFFRTLQIPELGGRDFDERDTPTSPKVAIVNETFARRVGDGANPIGKSFRIQGNPGEPEPWYRIVGLVRDTKYGSLREEFAPIVFLAESQSEEPNNAPTVFMRSNISLSALTPAVKRSISNIDPSLTFSFGVFKTDIREGLLPERLMATLSSLFGLLAVVLATVGLYGVMAYIVTRRRKEMGIRIALGADGAAVLSMVLREAATLLLVGVVIGLVLTLFAASAANSLLFGVPSWDPVSLLVAVGGLASIGLLASWIPALRASRVDPIEVLREE